MSIGNTFYIIAGDLNAIPTTIQPEQGLEHLDLINTNSLPNFEHCKELSLWIEENFCVDLFRLLHPTKLEFSYVPFSNTKTNRRFLLVHSFQQFLTHASMSHLKRLYLTTSKFFSTHIKILLNVNVL